MSIEELFGTLQQSVVAGWRKHLRSAKYSNHKALEEFYEEMPELVDDLIEGWMGANGGKVKEYINVLQSSNMNTLSYLKELKRIVKQGYELMGENDELKSHLDDILNLINSTLYKVKELSESKMISLSDFLNESMHESGSNLDKAKWTKNAQKMIDDIVKVLEKGDIYIENKYKYKLGITSYLNNDFYGVRSYKFFPEVVSLDECGIILREADGKMDVYIPFDSCEHKLKNWIESEDAVEKLYKYIINK